MGKRAVLAFLTCLCVFSGEQAMAKYADLAGSWYPASAQELRSEIESYISGAGQVDIKGRVIGAVAPHAGIRFSGPIAGYTYKAIESQHPSTVVVVGFSHRRYLPGGVAVFTEDAFVTPLGEMQVDTEITEKLMSYDTRIRPIPDIFEGENSVELQLPFIQVAAKDAKIVLLAMTDQREENCQALAGALQHVLKDKKDFVIVASTDMCHYLPYEAAVARDARTIELVKGLDPAAFYRESVMRNNELMCGYGAVYTVMEAAKRLGADEVEVLKYANSGDTSGMKDRVVGYLSALFVQSHGSAADVKSAAPDDAAGARSQTGPAEKEVKGMLNIEQKKELLKIARDTMKLYLETGRRLEPRVAAGTLKEDMGAFVTIHKKGELRGCIGNMVARGPLYLAVRDMAIAAATEDPRFASLTAEELNNVDIEISVLSPMRRVAGPDEIKIPGNGVMVRMGWRSGVYLPQVAEETGWSKEEFMNSLCAHKAGIPMDAWKTGQCEMSVFTAEVFGEKELGIKPEK